MTFDDFVIKLASNNDFFTWLREEIGSWNSSEAEAGGPHFETLADLREWNNGEIRGFYSDVIVAWVLVGAGVAGARGKATEAHGYQMKIG
jgi:hypothetical protein